MASIEQEWYLPQENSMIIKWVFSSPQISASHMIDLELHRWSSPQPTFESVANKLITVQQREKKPQDWIRKMNLWRSFAVASVQFFEWPHDPKVHGKSKSYPIFAVPLWCLSFFLHGSSPSSWLTSYKISPTGHIPSKLLFSSASAVELVTSLLDFLFLQRQRRWPAGIMWQLGTPELWCSFEEIHPKRVTAALNFPCVLSSSSPSPSPSPSYWVTPRKEHPNLPTRYLPQISTHKAHLPAKCTLATFLPSPPPTLSNDKSTTKKQQQQQQDKTIQANKQKQTRGSNNTNLLTITTASDVH